MLRTASRLARRAPHHAARRQASRVVKVKALPFDLNTEALLRNALGDADITPATIELRQRSSGRFNGAASLTFDDMDDAKKAFRRLRHDGIQVGGRSVEVAWGTSTFEPEPEPTREELEEDPLKVLTRVLDERRLPTLDQIRAEMLQNDQHDIVRQSKFPGLIIGDDEEVEEPPQPKKKKQIDPSEPLGKWAETIVKINRVQKVVRGGTIMRYRALVVVGNLMGAGGFAYGKGHSPRDAVARASKAAKRDLRYVERFRDTSLLHDVRGKHNNCIVDIYAKPPGSGIVGGPLGRRILTQLGFSSFTIKARGRRTPYSYCAAAFDALSKHRSVEEIARSRGRRILEVEHAAARHARSPFKVR